MGIRQSLTPLLDGNPAGRARADVGLGARGEWAAGACQLFALLDAASHFCHGAQVVFEKMTNTSYHSGWSTKVSAQMPYCY